MPTKSLQPPGQGETFRRFIESPPIVHCCGKSPTILVASRWHFFNFVFRPAQARISLGLLYEPLGPIATRPVPLQGQHVHQSWPWDAMLDKWQKSHVHSCMITGPLIWAVAVSLYFVRHISQFNRIIFQGFVRLDGCSFFVSEGGLQCPSHLTRGAQVNFSAFPPKSVWLRHAFISFGLTSWHFFFILLDKNFLIKLKDFGTTLQNKIFSIFL